MLSFYDINTPDKEYLDIYKMLAHDLSLDATVEIINSVSIAVNMV